MNYMNDIDNNQDIIDVRDIIKRVEEWRGERDDIAESPAALDKWDIYNGDELAALESLLSDMKGYGGDEQWEGDGYPVTLIRDSYFQDYAEQLADDIGAINSEAHWPNSCIDWKRAASELQDDYSTVEYDGVTYWYR